MGAYDGIEAFVARAEFMCESLGKSQQMTQTMVAILGSFDNRLSTLETAMRPTQVKTHAFRKAHENIDSTLKAAESALHQFEISHQVEIKVPEGPKSDLDGFLAACDQLHTNVEYPTLNRSMKASDTALSHARDLFGKGMNRLEEEFKVLLTNNSGCWDILLFCALWSKPADPGPLMNFAES